MIDRESTLATVPGIRADTLAGHIGKTLAALNPLRGYCEVIAFGLSLSNDLPSPLKSLGLLL